MCFNISRWLFCLGISGYEEAVHSAWSPITALDSSYIPGFSYDLSVDLQTHATDCEKMKTPVKILSECWLLNIPINQLYREGAKVYTTCFA